MYIKTYLKALLSGLNELFDLFGKAQSIITAAIGTIAIFYTANFTALLEPIKPYYPQLVIFIAFIALFVAGYRAWLKVYKANVEIESKHTEVKTTKASYRIISYGQFNKIQTLGLSLTFQVNNFNKHPIQVKRFDTKTIMKQFGFTKLRSGYIHSNYTFPFTIEPNTVKEFHFELPFEMNDMTFHEQLEHVKKVSHKQYSTKVEILSIKGNEEIDFPIDFDNSDFIIFLKDNSYKFNQEIIDAIL